MCNRAANTRGPRPASRVWHRGTRTRTGGYRILNHLPLGAALRRALRTPAGCALLPDGADGWTMGGCRVLGNALLRWARREGIAASRLLIEAASAIQVRQWGEAEAPRLPQHVVTVFRCATTGVALAVDGDGAGRLDEVLDRCAAVDAYHAPQYRPYRDARCDAHGWDAYSPDDAALDALLSRTLAPYRHTLRAAR